MSKSFLRYRISPIESHSLDQYSKGLVLRAKVGYNTGKESEVKQTPLLPSHSLRSGRDYRSFQNLPFE